MEMTRLNSMYYDVPSWPGLSRPSTPRRRHSAKLSHVDARIRSAHDEGVASSALTFCRIGSL
jgi:hypothetical protein